MMWDWGGFVDSAARCLFLGSRFALEPQATDRCLAEVPVPPGGPTNLFNGLGFYAGTPGDWNPLVWGIGGDPGGDPGWDAGTLESWEAGAWAYLEAPTGPVFQSSKMPQPEGSRAAGPTVSASKQTQTNRKEPLTALEHSLKSMRLH